MTVLAPPVTAINLEADCAGGERCSAFALRLHEQLATPHYSTRCSLMPVPDALEGWLAEHRTARRRSGRACRLGYTFRPVDYSRHSDEIFEINTSKAERQGRPMSAGYLKQHLHSPLPEQPCDRHRTYTFGVLERDVLRAYLTLHRAGELAMVSMILGHGDHLENDIMWLLFAGLVDDQAGQGGWFYYNLDASGLDGLRYYKQKQGFEPTDIELVLR